MKKKTDKLSFHRVLVDVKDLSEHERKLLKSPLGVSCLTSELGVSIFNVLVKPPRDTGEIVEFSEKKVDPGPIGMKTAMNKCIDLVERAEEELQEKVEVTL